MIIEPTTSQLMEKVPDKFELILTVAKRARELRGGKDRLTIFDHPNNQRQGEANDCNIIRSIRSRKRYNKKNINGKRWKN